MCPRCKSPEVIRSRSRFRDTLMLWLGMRPYRCRECNKRFHLPAKEGRKLSREQAWRKSASNSRESAISVEETTISVEVDPAS
jgi:transposase-like protein